MSEQSVTLKRSPNIVRPPCSHCSCQLVSDGKSAKERNSQTFGELLSVCQATEKNSQCDTVSAVKNSEMNNGSSDSVTNNTSFIPHMGNLFTVEHK